MAGFAYLLWLRVNEPRKISTYYFVAYVILAAVGAYAFISPPGTIAGAIGDTAMALLSALLVVGGVIGLIAVLPGKYWLERLGVMSISLASVIYLFIILTLHTTTPGNRLLQAGYVAFVLLLQGVRWERVKERPFRPAGPDRL